MEPILSSSFPTSLEIEISQQLTTILIHMNEANNLPLYILKLHFNIIIPYKPTHFKWIISYRFPNQNSVCISISLMIDTYKAHLCARRLH
jgi:hypothetical protein